MPTTIPAASLLTAGSVEENLTRPDLLMRPERLQSLPPSRFSAARAVLERMVEEQWTFERVRFDIDEQSRGEALYRVRAGSWTFDFITFGFVPDRTSRTGRITERNWDMMAALVDRESTPEGRALTREELPKLYAGRAIPGTLTWARSNRSFRAFDHVVDSLVAGEQPDTRPLWEIGYLMRNTGLDGNGTFNTRSFLALEDDHPLRDALHAQLFSAFMLREYAADLVDALARHRNPDAAQLSPELRRMIGIGNGSALGLLFFVNTHPHLIDAWLGERQQAIVEASRLPIAPGSDRASQLRSILERAATFYGDDPYVYHHFADPHAIGTGLSDAVETLDRQLRAGSTTGERLLEALIPIAPIESWEVVAASLLELLPPERVRAALDRGIVSETMMSRPQQTVAELKTVIDTEYAWALGIDMHAPGARHHVWYKSADAEEPRRGPAVEVTEGRNWALDVPSDVQRVRALLDGFADDARVGTVLAAAPQERAVIERIQTFESRPYHSPHMNMLDERFVPVSIVRFMNAAVHGLDRTIDEGDDRNVLGLIYLGAPTAADLNARSIDRLSDWRYPAAPRVPLAASSQR